VAVPPFLAGDTQGGGSPPVRRHPDGPPPKPRPTKLLARLTLLLSPPCISATGPPPPVSLQICDPIVRVRGHELEDIVIPAPYRSAADKHGL
jgi:hypothetical protein